MPLPENTSPRDEVAAILDHQFVSTRRGGYYKFLVQWKNHPHSESVWLQASELQRLHPHHFTIYLHHNLPESSSFGEPVIDANQEAEQAEQYQEDAIGAKHGTSKMPNMDTITTQLLEFWQATVTRRQIWIRLQHQHNCWSLGILPLQEV